MLLTQEKRADAKYKKAAAVLRRSIRRKNVKVRGELSLVQLSLDTADNAGESETLKGGAEGSRDLGSDR